MFVVDNTLIDTHETGDEIVVVCGHHSDLLRLLEHALDLLGCAVEHDVHLARLLDVAQQRAVVVVVVGKLTNNDLHVGLCRGFEELLKADLKRIYIYIYMLLRFTQTSIA